MTSADTSSKPLVHIVEDDASVRNGLSRLMLAADMDARAYHSAEEFLSTVRSEHNACLVLDITMPGITGLQLQEILNVRGVVLPVITVSASDDKAARQLSLDLGAKLFFRKPVDDQALLDAIKWVIDQNEHRGCHR